jgi:hypothetical protein
LRISANLTSFDPGTPQNGYIIAAGDDFKPHSPSLCADQKALQQPQQGGWRRDKPVRPPAPALVRCTIERNRRVVSPTGSPLP